MNVKIQLMQRNKIVCLYGTDDARKTPCCELLGWVTFVASDWATEVRSLHVVELDMNSLHVLEMDE